MSNNKTKQDLRSSYVKNYNNKPINTANYVSNLYLQNKTVAEKPQESVKISGYTPDWMVQSK